MQPLGEAVRALVTALSGSYARDIVEVLHSGHSPLAGQLAGRLLLKRGANGELSYQYLKAPSARIEVERAELEVNHRIDDLEDLKAYLVATTCQGKAAFVQTDRSLHAAVRVIDLDHPEVGEIHMAVERHPVLLRWSRAIPPTGRAELNLTRLSDLILESREDFEDSNLAGQVAELPKTDPSVPQELIINIPAYTGAWSPGDEPRHRTALRVMVVTPQGDDDEFLVRMIWADATAFEAEAARALVGRVREVLGGVIPVYLGKPQVTRYVIPRRSEP
jgi:hypothetical protein